jgi:uncharacterized RmlC-like cupin family protein
MGLLVAKKDVPNASVNYGGGLSTQMVYGVGGSLLWAERPAGYHSTPHIHASEQLNWVIDGELWFFVEARGFVARRGDFFRIPEMLVHWAWNRSEQPCQVVEAHFPGMQHDPMMGDSPVALFDETETARVSGSPVVIQVDQVHYKMVEVEEMAIRRHDLAAAAR